MADTETPITELPNAITTAIDITDSLGIVRLLREVTLC